MKLLMPIILLFQLFMVAKPHGHHEKQRNLRRKKKINKQSFLQLEYDPVEGSSGEEVVCGVSEQTIEAMEKDEAKLKLFRKQELDNGEGRRSALECDGCVEIPTHFHVIMDSSGNGVLTKNQISDQMDVLNDGFRGTPFRFSLINITWTRNSSLFSVADAFARDYASMQSVLGDELRVGDKMTLNLYSAGLLPVTLGFSSFPSANDGVRDGVFIEHCSIPGGNCYPYNNGKIAIHEVGHWLGLFHVFQGGCSSEHGDYVNDTAPQNGALFSCGYRNSCPDHPDPDPIQNYMGYAMTCLDEFTPGQITRMFDEYMIYRNGTQPCADDEGILSVELKLDDNPEQNEWRLYHSNGQLLSLSVFGASQENREASSEICIPYRTPLYFALEDSAVAQDGLTSADAYFRLRVDGKLIKDDKTFGRTGAAAFTMESDMGCPPDHGLVQVVLLLDDFPRETSWKILHPNGTAIYEEPEYTMLGSSTKYYTHASIRREMCLPVGGYSLSLHDSMGDGLGYTEQDEEPYFQISINDDVGDIQSWTSGFLRVVDFEVTEQVRPNPQYGEDLSVASASPSEAPSAFASGAPTIAQSMAPSVAGSTAPSVASSGLPTLSPSATPSDKPSSVPSPSPSIVPTVVVSSTPTVMKSGSPSIAESAHPSAENSSAPTVQPTSSPSKNPSHEPTSEPTNSPSASPTLVHSSVPTIAHSESPSATSSMNPTTSVSLAPSPTSSDVPTVQGSSSPSTTAPSAIPSGGPTTSPSLVPSTTESLGPTVAISKTPSGAPSQSSSDVPSPLPSAPPTLIASSTPSVMSSGAPSTTASSPPSAAHSSMPSSWPSSYPTIEPTVKPSASPSVASSAPTGAKSAAPSVAESTTPNALTSASPSAAVQAANAFNNPQPSAPTLGPNTLVCGSASVNQEDYRGAINTTVSGRTCQYWTSQYPHSHTRTMSNYPDSGLEANYCRNPGGWYQPWCYTTDPKVRWENCNIPVCETLTSPTPAPTLKVTPAPTLAPTPEQTSVKSPAPTPLPPSHPTPIEPDLQLCGSSIVKQADYRGFVSTTKSGRTCQYWTSQYPHIHTRTPSNYPDSGLEANYCRNPDGEDEAWCYTTDDKKRWEYCDIPVCKLLAPTAPAPTLTVAPAPTLAPTVATPQPTSVKSPAPTTGTQSYALVQSFTLINSNTNSPVRKLADGDKIILSQLPTINIRADTMGAVGSVKFEIDGQDVIVENIAPYSLGSNEEYDVTAYRRWLPTKLGPQKLKATIYPQTHAQGLPVDSLEITISIWETATIPTSPTITSITLINADTDRDVAIMPPQATINWPGKTPSITFRANVFDAPIGASVEFKIDGKLVRIENDAPYAIAGNSGNDYGAWYPSKLGFQTLTVTIYELPDAKGKVLASRKVSFQFYT